MGMDEMFGWTKKNAPRYMPETSGASDGVALNTAGLLSGCYVATATGWRPVEAIAVGDMIMTFDCGLCPVREVRRETFCVAGMITPSVYDSVFVPARALGNSKDIELLPDQGVLIESDAACDAHGDPFAVVLARSLVGYRGISRTPARRQIEVITLVFDKAQVIYANGGALIYCPPAEICLSDFGKQRDLYDVIPVDEAEFLVECMMVEDRARVAA
ncbi:MAG: Hint domain-containing protein [Tateyamaria sp.]|uniref:Hint domain-containing protein n=3 Tax=Tateyamaria sp. TaxID=1929288 RepID=UPI003282F546